MSKSEKAAEAKAAEAKAAEKAIEKANAAEKAAEAKAAEAKAAEAEYEKVRDAAWKAQPKLVGLPTDVVVGPTRTATDATPIVPMAVLLGSDCRILASRGYGRCVALCGQGKIHRIEGATELENLQVTVGTAGKSYSRNPQTFARKLGVTSIVRGSAAIRKLWADNPQLEKSLPIGSILDGLLG